jgi:hypothetical protein
MIYKAFLSIFLGALITLGITMVIPLNSDKKCDLKLDFSYELIWEKKLKVLNTTIIRTGYLIAQADYSQENLHRLFTFYSCKKRDISVKLDLYVYTDRTNALHDMEIFFPSNPDPAKEEEVKKYFYDAHFYRDGEGGTIGYRNEWFTYKQDINNLESGKTVTLKGRPPWGKEKVIDTWETENTPFKIRVKYYEREDVEPQQVYYSFQSVNKEFLTGSRNIITVTSPNIIEIPKRQIRFVNDKIGYLFMNGVYAVTLDAGHTWSVWDAELDLENWQCCNRQFIEEVALVSDGTGKMKITPIKHHSNYISELYTGDYGKHWSVK